MKLIIAANAEEAGKKAFLEIKTAVDRNPRAVLGLATGSTPLPLYNEIIADRKKNGTSYKNITTFNLDEYVGLSANDPQSYIRFMKDSLFDHIDIDMKNVNIPCGTADDLDAECKRYSKLLSEKVIDVQILGIGGNGHIAFNEPGTSFESTTHITPLTEKTIQDNARFFDDENKVPRFAITMGISEIMRAKKIIIIATGANKADAVCNMIKGEVTEQCPASILQRHEDVVCILDAGAASKI